LTSGLGFTLFPFPSLTGPRAVSGLRGSSVSVPCQYDEGYQETPKYWCSGIIWQSFVTTGSEAMVKSDRVSIKDIGTFCTFIVTMKNLTEGDSGTYWCGIERLGVDLMFSVKVNVLPGKFLQESSLIFTEMYKDINPPASRQKPTTTRGDLEEVSPMSRLFPNYGTLASSSNIVPLTVATSMWTTGLIQYDNSHVPV
uniref:Immunoglobulin domain-containing protein n=1 Tax=Chelydra serpentina TaxID=8475 RepID=A0A8C3SVM2_CHESE